MSDIYSYLLGHPRKIVYSENGACHYHPFKYGSKLIMPIINDEDILLFDELTHNFITSNDDYYQFEMETLYELYCIAH